MQNDRLQITISPKGAELTSIRDVQTGFEYLWQADAAVWGRHAPILFPIVGKVKNNTLIVNEKPYPMSQHGFARDAEFVLFSETPTSQWYQLKSNANTLAVYPFPFELLLGYTLEGNTLHCHYKVINTGTEPLYFSIGAHPGFNLPVPDLTEYLIVFDQNEIEERKLLSEGLFNGTSKPVLSSPNHIQLFSELFNDDAIVFKQLISKNLRLKHQNSSFEIALEYKNFPYMGIWTQKNNESYICLEPWCGHADGINGHDDISTKEGIEKLEVSGVFERTYSLTLTS